jgi:hypothetical protein
MLAWILGVAGTLACCAGAAVSIAFRAPDSLLPAYVVGGLMAVLGAVIATREPRNSIGWLMCAVALAVSLIHLPAGYAYYALAIQHGSWPLGSLFAWWAAWSWVPQLALLPLISVRFPDGKAQGHMRAVDWLAIAGVTIFALAIALEPAAAVLGFMPIPYPRINEMLPYFHDAAAGLLPVHLLAQLQGLGLVFMVGSYVASATALLTRLRDARGDQRLQIEWFAYAGALVAVALVYGGLAWNFLGQPLYIALTPLGLAALGLPVALGIAILRYRLYDIDLLINRTLVYAGLTAILGALYAAVVTFLNRLFISVSGQKSDAAYVVTAFVVAVAFGPVRDWLQRQVDRRVGRRDAPQLLDEFRTGVDAVVAVLDADRVMRQLVDQAVGAFNARGAALYVGSSAEPVYTRGDWSGRAGADVAMRHDSKEVGRLVMGVRRGGAEYAERDRAALQRSADSVAEAIALAGRLGRHAVPVAAN